MKYWIALPTLCVLSFQSCEKTIYFDVVSITHFSVWNEAPHNAFTDLISFDGSYYCVFREGSDHNSFDGKIRIIRSADGINWESISLLSVQNNDLRDAHFFVDDNKVLSVSVNMRAKNSVHQNIVYKLKGSSFVQANNLSVDNDYFFWGFSKFADTVYSIGYNIKQICFNSLNSSKPKIKLFSNRDTDCLVFSDVNVSNSWNSNNFDCPCESSMVFMPDSTLIVIVRDEETPGQSHFGISKFPFKDWTWKQAPFFVRGPKLALLPNGKLFLAAGSMAYYNKTYYAIINPADFTVEKMKVFPSGGDCGYPGVVIEGNTALVSYYSSHEGNARVYIDRIKY